MTVLIKDVVKACRELGWRCNMASIISLAILMIAEDIFTQEQLKVIAEKASSAKIRRAAELKLARASKEEILMALELEVRI